MAEQIPFGIAECLLMKLGSTVFVEIGLMYGVQGELTKLKDTLSTVTAVLLDAEEKQEESHAVAVWVSRLKDVVYDADDLLDDFATEDLRRRADDRGRFAGQVSDFFSSSNHLAFRFKMGHRIKAIRERLDVIASNASKFNFTRRVISSDVRVGNRERETCSVVEKSHKIVGRDENRKEIIELLMQSSSQETLSVVVIVGMGGLGKTTLARLVYKDQGVVSYFNLKMWVCVSDDFDVGALVKNILRSATKEDVGNLPLDSLQQLLQEKLRGKRYLLVLDDVWNEDVNKWGELITLLSVGTNGSKILVTTRSSKVASVIGIDSPYVVQGLKEDESWDLFQSLAFRREENPNLVPIGKDIVKMCKGVPLVVKTVGRILYSETEESHWLRIKNNKNLLLIGDENENNILKVLRLSYDNLPFHLKQCFTYCALFPKNYIIKKRLLVQLWMAQGYIQVCDENTNLEDVGNKYFEALLSRSLFQKVEIEYSFVRSMFEVDKENLVSRLLFGKVENEDVCIQLHDLIHDLAQTLIKSEVVTDVNIIPNKFHHVSLLYNSDVLFKHLIGKPVRTFLMDSVCGDYYKIYSIIPSLKCLRVMKLSFELRFELKVPISLGKLSHLRYLDLSDGLFENLPNTITRLMHLQTLKLLRCFTLKELPRNMKKLSNLRHLDIDEWSQLGYMPRGLGEMTKLQTLPLFVVGNDSRRKRMGRLSELKFLNNLRGQLLIAGLSNARGSEAKEANLEGKQYLEFLKLAWGGEEAAQESEEAVSVMESLQPHSNLKKLSIWNYKGDRFPNWMMNDGLDLLPPNLVKIGIWGCNRCKVLPPLGQLPSLKDLSLWDLNAVEYMKDYPSSAKPFFPSLKTLQIHSLPNLEEWGRRRDVAVGLEYLHLGNISSNLCSHLISVSSSLKYLSISRIEDVISLREGLQHVSTLQTLRIEDFSGSATLPDWIGGLTSLTELRILKCPNLTSLPEEMRSLRNLCKLEIKGCPTHFYERCQKETGEDWPKISHIPEIDIW